MTTLKSGVQITVDTSDIDTKFTKSVQELNAGLSKSQKALRLFYNDQGMLSNALGQTVEGLTQAQIKLGQYVDSLGNTRTFQGGFVSGLNKSQIEMGFYADALGNVYNKQNQLVKISKDLAAALNGDAAASAKVAQTLKEAGFYVDELTGKVRINADEFQRLTTGEAQLYNGLISLGVPAQQLSRILSTSINPTNQFSNAIQKAATAAGNAAQGMALTSAQAAAMTKKFTKATVRLSKASTTLALLSGVMINATGATSGLESTVATCTKTVAQALTIFAAYNHVAGFVKSINAASKSVGTLNATLAAMGGPAGVALLALGLVAAASAALFKYYNSQITQLSDKYKTLAEEAKKAGKNVKDINELLDFKVYGNGLDDTLTSLEERLKRLQERQEEVNKKFENFHKLQQKIKGALSFISPLFKFIPDMKSSQEKDAENQVNNTIGEIQAKRQEMMKTALDESQSASEKTRKLLDDYIDLYEHTVKSGKGTAEELEALQGKIKQLEGVYDNQIKEEAFSDPDLLKRVQEKEVQISNEGGNAAQFSKRREELNDAIRRGLISAETGARTFADMLDEMAGNIASLSGIDLSGFSEEEFLARASEETMSAYETLTESLKRGAINLDDFSRQFETINTQSKLDAIDATVAEAEEKFKAGMIGAAGYVEIVKGAAESRKNVFLDTVNAEENVLKQAEKLAQLYKDNNIDKETYDEEVKKRRDAIGSELGVMFSDSETGAAMSREQIEWTNALGATKDKINKLDEMLAAQLITQKQYNEGVEQVNNDLLKSSSILSSLLGNENESLDAIQRAEKEHVEQLKKIDELEQEGVLSVQKAEEMRARADERLARIIEQESAKRQSDMRKELGVDSLLESIKTPVQKFSESVDKINEALNAGAVTFEEATLLYNNATAEYENALKTESEKAAKQMAADRKRGAAGVETAEAGSTALYQAILRTNNVAYQDMIKRTTADILDETRASVAIQQNIGWQCENIVGALSGNQGEVWG